MKRTLIVAIGSAVLLSASPSAVQAADPAPASAPAVSPEVAPPPAGKGQVVFFRRSSIMGFPYWTNIRENGVAYGKLSNGVYFIQVLDPGTHEFNTSVLGKDSMKVQVDPGETYYVEGKITMALIGYTVIMAPSDEGTFNMARKGLKLAKPPEAVAAR